MADKYISQVSGVLTEKEALAISAGAGDAGKIIALDAGGKLPTSMLPSGIGAETATVDASENLAAGDFVNIYNDTTAKVRKADATTAGKEANGFVLDSVTSGSSATIHLPSQINNQLSGLTPGATYWLSATAGGVVSSPPSSSGNVVQKVGRAVSATEIMVDFSEVIVLA